MVLSWRNASIFPEHLPEIGITYVQFLCEIFDIYIRVQVFPKIQTSFSDFAFDCFSGKFLIADN